MRMRVPVPAATISGFFLILGATQLTGCLGTQLKQLEIRQLQEESAAITAASDYLVKQPALATAYDARLFIRGDAFNRFLQGLNQYDVPIVFSSGPVLWPKDPFIRFEEMQLEFKDGLPLARIKAKAMESSGTLEVELRIRASLLITPGKDEDGKDQLEVRYLIKEILPDIHFSIFRWREFWFGAAVFNIALQQLVDALPATGIPLQPEVAIDVDPKRTDRIEFNGAKAWIDVDRTLPHFTLAYAYRIARVLTLQDGLHVFFTLERKQ